MRPEDDLDPFSAAANAAGGVAAGYDTSMLNDPEKFVFDWGRTLDPHDRVQPIKPFPRHPFMRDIIRVMVDPGEHFIVIPKSRQMQATWAACAVSTYLAMSQQGAMNFMVSRKEDDAGFARPLSLLSRCFFIYQHLPHEVQLPHTKGLQPPMLSFPAQYSSIMGLTQDSDALRQQTATLVVCDEWAFQEKADASYAAMLPTIEGGGKIIGISTSNGKRNLFARIVHDIPVEKEDW